MKIFEDFSILTCSYKWVGNMIFFFFLDILKEGNE